MAELIDKIPLNNLALLLGIMLIVVGVPSQITTKWFSITLTLTQRVFLGVVGFALTIAAFLPKNVVCTASTRCLPVVDLPLVEKASPLALKDGNSEIFLRAKEVHRFNGPGDIRQPYTELEYDTKPGVLINSKNIYPGQKFLIEIDGRSYNVGYERAGQLDKPATDKNGQAIDVVLMSVERTK